MAPWTSVYAGQVKDATHGVNVFEWLNQDSAPKIGMNSSKKVGLESMQPSIDEISEWKSTSSGHWIEHSTPAEQDSLTGYQW